MRFLLAFCAAGTLAGRVPASELYELTGAWYASNGDAPYIINKTMFDSLMSKPQASGLYPFPGPNISVLNPPSNLTWSWSVAVASDIPAASAQLSSPTSHNLSESYFTAAEVRLHGPDMSNQTGEVDADHSWNMCITAWRFARDAFDDRLRSDDGSCSSVFNSQCVADIEQAALAYFYDNRTCGCPDIGAIASCADSGVNNYPGLGPFGSSSCDAQRIVLGKLNPTWERVVFTYGDPLHAQGDMGAYNDTGSRGWPVMAMWSQDFDAPYNMAKLSCVRAANASSGSATPGWNGTITNGTTTSIGTRSHALPLGLALGSLLLVFGVIVL